MFSHAVDKEDAERLWDVSVKLADMMDEQYI